MIRKKYKCKGDICFIMNEEKRKEVEFTEDRKFLITNKKTYDESLGNINNSNIYISEDERYVYVKNFPAAFGDRENKKGRVYDQDSLKKGAIQFKETIKEYPYFAYMFDGHFDEDNVSYILGKVDNVRIDETNKAIIIDFVIYKNSQAGKLLADMIRRGDPVNVSMRILAAESIKGTKEELKRINPDIVFIEDVSPTLAKLFSKDVIEYLYGDMYIWRIDIVAIPSFNETFGTSSYVQKIKTKENVNTYSESFKVKSLFRKENPINSMIYKNKFKNLRESLKETENNISLKKFNTYINQIISEILLNNPEDIFDKNFIESIQNNDIFSLESIIEYFGIISPDNVFKYLEANKEKDKLNIFELLSKIINDWEKINYNSKLYQAEAILDIYIILLLIAIKQLFEDKKIEIDFNDKVNVTLPEVKENRLKVFKNSYEEIIKDKLINSKDLNDFVLNLYSLLSEHGKKYRNILTFYGSVKEFLKTLLYYLLKEIKEKNKKKEKELKIKSKFIKFM